MQKVLIIDDDDDYRKKVIREIHANKLDVDIIEAATEIDAINAIKSLSFDVCLLDMEFPNFSKFGIEVARTLKDKNHDQQIIIQSEYSNELIRDQIHDELDIAYFYKKDYCQDRQDYDFIQLIVRLKRALETAKKLNKRKLKIKKTALYSQSFDIDDVRYVQKIKGTKDLNVYACEKDQEKVICHKFKRISLKEIPDMLELSSDLMQVSRSCMINPQKVVRVDFVEKKIILQDVDEEIDFDDSFKKSVELLR